MSTGYKPFAKGGGIMIGIVILWAAWLAVFWMVKGFFVETPV